jgi:hypothetical protein
MVSSQEVEFSTFSSGNQGRLAQNNLHETANYAIILS